MSSRLPLIAFQPVSRTGEAVELFGGPGGLEYAPAGCIVCFGVFTPTERWLHDTFSGRGHIAEDFVFVHNILLSISRRLGTRAYTSLVRGKRRTHICMYEDAR